MVGKEHKATDNGTKPLTSRVSKPLFLRNMFFGMLYILCLCNNDGTQCNIVAVVRTHGIRLLALPTASTKEASARGPRRHSGQILSLWGFLGIQNP